MCVGAGLLHTLEINSGANAWIGYQVCAGVGVGECLTQSHSYVELHFDYIWQV